MADGKQSPGRLWEGPRATRRSRAALLWVPTGQGELASQMASAFPSAIAPSPPEPGPFLSLSEKAPAR